MKVKKIFIILTVSCFMALDLIGSAPASIQPVPAASDEGLKLEILRKQHNELKEIIEIKQDMMALDSYLKQYPDAERVLFKGIWGTFKGALKMGNMPLFKYVLAHSANTINDNTRGEQWINGEKIPNEHIILHDAIQIRRNCSSEAEGSIYLKMFKVLVKNGANKEASDYKDTPLLLSSREADYEATAFLISEGANALAKDQAGMTALEIAKNMRKLSDNPEFKNKNYDKIIDLLESYKK